MVNHSPSVCLALIHNNNPQRNAHVRPALTELRTRLQEHFPIMEISVASQPVVRPHDLTMAFLRDAVYQSLEREWCRYRLIGPQFLPLNAYRFLRDSITKYSHGGNGWGRNSSIEMIVTDKHVRAWSAFLDENSDFLICFEDDAVFKDDSTERVMELLDIVSKKDSASPIYVDLAGGLALEELRIGNIESYRDALFRHYSKPVTNTACVYLMNRTLVTAFHQLITRRPWLRLIGIDWMMNKLFMLLTHDGAECICMHADPPIFKHGTTTGEYLSWQAEGTH